ncbi:MAG: glycosyltransferase family 4 protein [Methylococcaceae bacterium]|jgi:glycosyltransferase involved in cell wall biosynthesis
MANNLKKRIIYVENGIGYGGAIICLRHLIRNLDRSNYQALVVTGRTGDEYANIKNDAQWQHIPDRHLDIVAAHQKIDPAIWPDKVPGLRFVINQILARSDDLANFLPFFIHLLWTTWRFKADLIHANNEPLCNRAALLVGNLLKIPTIAHVRGGQQGSHLMRWSFGLVDHFIPVSHWVAASIQSKLDIPAHKISVIYDGLELGNLLPTTNGEPFRQHYQLKPNDFAVGLVGLLIAWKGQELFLDAAVLLKARIPNLKMLIIGGTPEDCAAYEQALKLRVQQQGLGDMVIFTGHVSTMASVYCGLDVIVSASTSPEPLGTVVIESMTLARPLIGPNHGGAAEMMQHNVTGLLFEPKNAADLAEKIETFYRQPNLRSELGKAARKKALATFSIEEHVAQVQRVYENLLTNTTSGQKQ